MQVAIYKSDFDKAGGFDTNIQGWGKEDSSFCERVLDSGLTVLRAPDPGIIHLYHGIHCDYKLPRDQYKDCLGTRWGTLGSEGCLMETVQKLNITSSWYQNSAHLNKSNNFPTNKCMD